MTTITGAAVIQTFLSVVGVFFILYLIGYSTFLFLSVTVGSSFLYRRKRETHYKNQIMADCYVPVSVIVPAYNESVTVVSSVSSLLKLDYSLYEIIVVDDGSTDDTAQQVIDAFDLHEIERPIRLQVPCNPVKSVWYGMAGSVPITLVRKENGGKADALNMGINLSQYPYFVGIDADSVLQYDSLHEIIAPVIEYENVVAVGGLVRLSNGVELKDGRLTSYSLPKQTIPAMQVLEYDRSFLSARILFDQFNGNLIISGAFGLFRKDVVVACGGYDRDTVGEDMELVTKLHVFCRTSGRDYLIKYAPEAICWSQAPASLHDLINQRKRWHRGLFECMTKHWRVFANLRYGLVGALSYSYFLVYELLSPIIELFGILTMILAVAFNFVNVPYMILFFLIYAVYGAIMSLTAFFSRVQTRDLHLSKLDVVRALCLSLFEVTILRFIMAVTRMLALVGYRKKDRRWDKITRTQIKAE
ncbi:glycosyltransferase family 2 protein [Adlercreutzia equolifaciens]|uniref:glycosyltransferase family 2 protein n=1 Tax=Adlercreutzia equolifaciens TaxID=446660 RepID=UPI0003898B47|nr:glycosyltransferase [Adlercreutzia equolifaciens]RFT81476.1 glycosyltransferase family 2 protein [Adlercreutzia equolifaciens]BAN78238.1 glycosyltransferase [Adlercreutzia equolifaciens DSM 19450]